MPDETSKHKKTASARRAMALYNKLKALRDKQREERLRREALGLPEPASGDDAVLPRMRSTKDRKGRPTVNLSKADADCVRCGGSGLRDPVVITEGEETVTVPVVCVCVHRNGGVKKDLLDKMSAREEKREKRRKMRSFSRRLRRRKKNKHKRN